MRTEDFELIGVTVVILGFSLLLVRSWLKVKAVDDKYEKDLEKITEEYKKALMDHIHCSITKKVAQDRRSQEARLNWDASAAEAQKRNKPAMVRKWLRAMGFTRVRSWQKVIDERTDKLFEELFELCEAYNRDDLHGVADAVADMQVVLESIPLLCRYDGDAAFRAVMASNMTKDPALFIADGKGKGANFKEPDFTRVRGL